MTAAADRTFGIVGALAAFPLRLAAREVARQGGRMRRGTGRRTTDVVLGRRLPDKASDAAIEARVAAERAAGRRLLSENGFLRLLGLAGAPAASALPARTLLDQSGLPPRAFELLALFDAFEHDAEPHSFRDLILARKYAGLLADGAGWGAIARAVHRSGGASALTAQSLQPEGGTAIYACHPGGRCEVDGQMLLDLGQPADAALDDFFAGAETAEEAGRHAEAAALYQRCLALDPGDPVAAFNRANCLRAAGRAVEAAHDYARAIKLDPGFVEAWFNLAGLMVERGHPGSARRHLRRAVAIDGDYADAIYNLAKLAFDAGDLAEAGRLWERYLELDASSEWARTAARGLKFLALQSGRGSAG